jgi:pimeloyl-ACP methyl ester carboxylesterase
MTRTFDELYRDVPAQRRERVLQFRAAHPFKHFTAKGVTWDYVTGGQGQQVLVILGGGMSMGDTSIEAITRFESRFRVISPSYPPTGDLARVCDGLAALLEAEGVTPALPAHLYGHSLGSGVVHVFVRRCPDLAGRLVLGSFGLYNERNARAIKLFFRLPFWALRAYYRRAMVRLSAGAPPDERAVTRAAMEELFERHTRESFMGQMGLLVDLIDHAVAYRAFDPVERPGRVLIIAAKDDRGFDPGERDRMIATYPGVQVKLFEDGGHWVSLIHRAEYNAVLDRFLES